MQNYDTPTVDTRKSGELIDKLNKAPGGREKLYQVQQELDRIEVNAQRIKERLWALA